MSRKSEGHLDNEKKILIVIVACVGLVAVGGVGLFAIQFAQYGLSPSTSDWANFGSFVGGILGPLLSLLTIFYMVWSFKKQTAMVQEQLKQDKRKDECSMLMNELKVQIAKIETAFSQDAELSDVADKYFYYLHGKEKELKRINSRIIEVEGEAYSADVFPLLVTLKVQAGEEAFKAFVHEVKGSVFYHPVDQEHHYK